MVSWVCREVWHPRAREGVSLLSRGTLSLSKAASRNILKYQNSPHPSRAGQGQPSCSDRSLSSLRNVSLRCLWGQMQFCEPLWEGMQKHLKGAQKRTASQLGYGPFYPKNSDLREEESFSKVSKFSQGQCPSLLYFNEHT